MPFCTLEKGEEGYTAGVEAAAEAWRTGRGITISHTNLSIREVERRNPNVSKD